MCAMFDNSQGFHIDGTPTFNQASRDVNNTDQSRKTTLTDVGNTYNQRHNHYNDNRNYSHHSISNDNRISGQNISAGQQHQGDHRDDRGQQILNGSPVHVEKLRHHETNDNRDYSHRHISNDNRSTSNTIANNQQHHTNNRAYHHQHTYGSSINNDHSQRQYGPVFNDNRIHKAGPTTVYTGNAQHNQNTYHAPVTDTRNNIYVNDRPTNPNGLVSNGSSIQLGIPSNTIYDQSGLPQGTALQYDPTTGQHTLSVPGQAPIHPTYEGLQNCISTGAGGTTITSQPIVGDIKDWVNGVLHAHGVVSYATPRARSPPIDTSYNTSAYAGTSGGSYVEPTTYTQYQPQLQDPAQPMQYMQERIQHGQDLQDQAQARMQSQAQSYSPQPDPLPQLYYAQQNSVLQGRDDSQDLIEQTQRRELSDSPIPFARNNPFRNLVQGNGSGSGLPTTPSLPSSSGRSVAAWPPASPTPARPSTLPTSLALLSDAPEVESPVVGLGPSRPAAAEVATTAKPDPAQDQAPSAPDLELTAQTEKAGKSEKRMSSSSINNASTSISKTFRSSLSSRLRGRKDKEKDERDGSVGSTKAKVDRRGLGRVFGWGGDPSK